jgi:transposase
LVNDVGPIHLSILRKVLVNKDSILLEHCQWLLQTPRGIRDQAVISFCTALKAAFSNNAAGNITKFRMSYKSRRDMKQTLYVDRRVWNRINNGGRSKDYGGIFGSDGIRTAKGEIVGDLECDSTLMLSFPGKFELCISERRQAASTTPPRVVASLDPGVRTFQTVYDPEGQVFELGLGRHENIQDACIKLDEIQSKSTRVNHRKRYLLRLRAARLRRRIVYARNDMHFKIAKFLCERYQHIIIPIFKVQEMVCRNRTGKKRTIRSKTARRMLNLGHYRFRQILISKARLTNTTIHVVTEEYTSKACGNCGQLNNIGGNKIYKCAICNAQLDRDFNGARNILLKQL